MNEPTTDTFFSGRIQVRQPRRGYRFSIDAVLLAHLAAPRRRDRILDLGAGCGIVSLILAWRHPDVRIRGIELQTALADLAKENVSRNRLADRIGIDEADLRTLHPDDVGGLFEMVVCNPPYRRPRSGRMNPDSQKAIARHEIEVLLADVVSASRRLLRRSGRLCIVYPAERMSDLVAEMRSGRIEPKRMLAIHSRMDAEAKLVFVEGVYGAGPGVKIEPPLAIYGPAGEYTPELAEMLAGESR
jgi:tRNA1Val (adenine37-N6)-methyltransferase